MEMRGWIVKVTEEKWEGLKHDIQLDKSDYMSAWCNFSKFADCYGNFMKGALCVDVIYRDIDDPEWILCGDGYILGEDTGYGYANNGIPYDEADGFRFDFDLNKTYEEMVNSMIDQIEAYIAINERWREAVTKTDPVWTEDM